MHNICILGELSPLRTMSLLSKLKPNGGLKQLPVWSGGGLVTDNPENRDPGSGEMMTYTAKHYRDNNPPVLLLYL